jgi:hypothetical protein
MSIPFSYYLLVHFDKKSKNQPFVGKILKYPLYFDVVKDCSCNLQKEMFVIQKRKSFSNNTF